MATTTNFGWDTPDDTDLVKDGALAIRTLGSSIDTSLVDLKGGTTGQVLSKASNTDLDYTWVTTDDANAIQNAIVDAKGDLIAASAADTPARLAVGNNGETLVADSAATTGLRYQSGYNGNAVINGGMDIWQRGTSFTSASVYTADRWFKGSQANWTTSRQTSSLTGIQYALRLQRDSGNSSTTGCIMAYNIETADALRFADKTVVVSFYARAGANYSPTSSNFLYTLYTGTGTDQRRDQSTGFTGEATVATANVTLTTSWQRFSFTASIGSTATEIALTLGFVPTGTAGAADYADFTGVQIELGSAATTFKRAGGTLQGELAACQRYYIRLNDSSNALIGNGSASSTTATALIVNLPTSMRVRPATVDFTALQVSDGVTNTAVTTVTSGIGNQSTQYINAGVASGLTQYRPYYLQQNGSTGYLAFSAEL